MAGGGRKRHQSKLSDKSSGNMEKRARSIDSRTRDEAVTTSSFVSTYLASLKDDSVKTALSEIISQGVAALQREIFDLKATNLAQRDEISALRTELANAESTIGYLSISYQNARAELGDLQQYTRRNALRITNPAWRETDGEDTDSLVLELAAQLNVDLQPWEISRSHRVGKPVLGKVRPVLVKFIGYRSRQRLYKARKDLKRHTALKKVYINEDLTKATSELAFKARQLKRRGVIAETFTSDCKVFVKKFPGSNLVLIRNEDELNELSFRVPYNSAINRQSVQQSVEPSRQSGSMPDPSVGSVVHGTVASATADLGAGSANTGCPAAMPGSPLPSAQTEGRDTEPMDDTTLSSDQSELLIRNSELTSSTPKPLTANDMNNTDQRSPCVAQGDGNAGSKNDAAS